MVGMQAFKQLQLFFSQAVCLLFALWLEHVLNRGWKKGKTQTEPNLNINPEMNVKFNSPLLLIKTRSSPCWEMN